MAKIKVVKGKYVKSKRNLYNSLKTSLLYLNTLAVIYILLRMFEIIK